MGVRLRTPSRDYRVRMSDPSKVIVTAANSAFYELVTDTVASVRDKPQGCDIPVVIFDVGLTEAERRALRGRNVEFVAPGWDYSFRTPPPQWFKAMTARTRIPSWVPNYDLYLWVDSDAWVQRWDTVELLFEAAQKQGFAVVAESDRAYPDAQACDSRGNLISALQGRLNNLRNYFGDIPAHRYANQATLNCGVFAARSDSPIWSVWPKLMAAALSSERTTNYFFAEQTAMNVALLSGKVPFARLPSLHNWLLTGALPRVAANGDLVHPDFPHEPLGIIHRAAGSKFAANRLCDVDGRQTEIGTAYRCTR
jgi:hypothetical protein